MKRSTNLANDIIPESRTAQIVREMEALVSGFVTSTAKRQTSDSLFYLTRERASLMRNFKPQGDGQSRIETVKKRANG